jgi:hypothetical protein
MYFWTTAVGLFESRLIWKAGLFALWLSLFERYGVLQSESTVITMQGLWALDGYSAEMHALHSAQKKK